MTHSDNLEYNIRTLEEWASKCRGRLRHIIIQKIATLQCRLERIKNLKSS
jgi:hypothetical protein